MQAFICFLSSASEEIRIDSHTVEYQCQGSTCLAVRRVILRNKKHFNVFQVEFVAIENTFNTLDILVRLHKDNNSGVSLPFCFYESTDLNPHLCMVYFCRVAAFFNEGNTRNELEFIFRSNLCINWQKKSEGYEGKCQTYLQTKLINLHLT